MRAPFEQLELFSIAAPAAAVHDFDFSAAEYEAFDHGCLVLRLYLQRSEDGRWLNGFSLSLPGRDVEAVRPVTTFSSHETRDDTRVESAIQLALVLDGLPRSDSEVVPRPRYLWRAYQGLDLTHEQQQAVRNAKQWALERAGGIRLSDLYVSNAGDRSNVHGVFTVGGQTVDFPVRVGGGSASVRVIQTRTPGSRWLSGYDVRHTSGSMATAITTLIPFINFGSQADAFYHGFSHIAEREAEFFDSPGVTSATEQRQARALHRWAVDLAMQTL
jgi:hypothetical protein